jgi:hypothetical protein
MNHLFTGTPESLLRLASNAPAGYPTDAINCALDRAEAVLLMLSGQFDGSNEDRLNDSIISTVISAIHGEMRLIKTMLAHGSHTTKRQHPSPTQEA